MFGAGDNSPSATYETEHPDKARCEDQFRHPRGSENVPSIAIGPSIISTLRTL